MESIFYRDIEQNIMMIQKALPVGKSFDIITREIYWWNKGLFYKYQWNV